MLLLLEREVLVQRRVLRGHIGRLGDWTEVKIVVDVEIQRG
jgi:hypothetical protein